MLIILLIPKYGKSTPSGFVAETGGSECSASQSGFRGFVAFG